WVAEHVIDLGGAPGRLAVGGSSAGAGLAAATALALRDRGGPALALQLLVYPMLDDRMDSPSMLASDDMPLLTRHALADAWGHYLAGRDADCYAAPARAADLRGLPSAFVLVAEQDPLRDEGLEYAGRLTRAGVPTELHLVPGAFHGFDIVGLRAEVSRLALDLQAGALRRAW
ncbi:MAG TPA: alpha/beta hydrolase fold domain-containing protein, partial [Acidimicrobiales bacterium]|nr:alpha/beta hydrolase fold domain-containing protein [Acidimicrobiales bacterium]